MVREQFFDVDQWRLLKQRSVEALLGDRFFLTRYASFCVLAVMWVVFLLVIGSVVQSLDDFFGSVSQERYDVASWALLVVVYGVFWMGASAGAGALVRERAMFVRECSVAGLNVAAYLVSKLHSLSLLGVLTVAVYLPIMGKVKGGGLNDVVWAPVGWVLIVLLATVVCGICLGLMVSALSRSVRLSQVLVAVVVFGMLFLAGDFEASPSRWEMILYRLSPLGWSRASLLEYGAAMPDDLLASGYLLALVWFSMVFLAIAYVFLKRQGYGDLRE